MNGLDVKQIRKNKKWTQEKLAQVMGCTIMTIQNWEKGKNIPSTRIPQLEALLAEGALEEIPKKKMANRLMSSS